ncbi:hypothetical protein BZK31_24285 [Pseudomonas floridensis]|uniref:FHA domain-containing protein n=1 Tax=Pseudomonas floridensis TaxID=1958950 RepID=A0A1X0MZK2_9PSED|nr:type VI secretion system-associated FHA domain protein TagH [Pseudomonas floridensis]ORC55778.1 hypothetical protein BZK31_24285 [Pseudomonas floridensis]
MELVFEVSNPLELREGCARSWTFGPSGGVAGRSHDCEWCIEDQARHVSRQHVRVSYESDAFYLTDISSNGTLVNGVERIKSGEKRRVRHGDNYLFGRLEVRARLVELQRSQNHRQHQTFSAENQSVDELDPLAALQARGEMHCLIDDLSTSDEGRVRSRGSDVHAHVEREHLLVPELITAPQPDVSGHYPQQPDGRAGLFWQQFGNALNVDLSGVGSSGREALAVDVARLFKQCLEGLEHSSSTRNELKSELQSASRALVSDGESPFETSAIESVIKQLLLRQPTQAAQTIARSFRDSQAHQVALMAGCRAMARSTLEHFSPQRLHWQFEHESRFCFRTSGSRWRAYVQHHRTLSQDDTWSAGLWGRDFADAYDQQIRLINAL